MDSERDYSTNEQVEESEQDSIEIQRDDLDLKGRLEALLFVAPFPTPVSQFAAVLDTTTRMVDRAVDELQDDYISHHRGIRIQKHAGKIQLISAPEASLEIQAFLNLESTTRLTTAALEVLSIVAYLGPATRPQIDAIRGVNSDSVLRTILRFGLVEETGRSEGPGRPFLYAVTNEFLQNFGLNSIEDLPPLGFQMEMESES
jgi:segregation and condensation protein B